MSATLLLVCLVQQLAVQPYPACVGDQVSVRAVRDDAPLPGLVVRLVTPDGAERTFGTTDAAGMVRGEVAVAGLHRFESECDGIRLLAPLPVLPERRRWLYGLVCIPLGAALLHRIWRRPRAGS